ncbi:MAG: abortive infection family protein [Salinibacter sp.]|uniref:abortive infection family protein n=1 Tax=Salinibacter sp. TaxID=2065818 RepID=UPI0035D40D90
MSDELFRKAERLQELLVGRATGGAHEDDEYRALRRHLREDPRAREQLPDFVERCRTLQHFWSFIKNEFGTYKKRRQFLWREFSPLLDALEEGGSPSDPEVEAVLDTLDSNHVQRVWQKALERRKNDPEGAITASRTLIESVCKRILEELGVEYDEKDDLPNLYHHVAEELNLAPGQYSEPLFGQILGNCQSVVQGLGAIRNVEGDAHGSEKRYRAQPRHAELTVNLAGSMATFLVRTWKAREVRE